MAADSWEDLIARLRKVEVHRDLTVRKSDPPSRPHTFKARAGIPLKASHYSKPLKGGGGIHLKEFSDRYMVHRDHADANEEPIQHLLKDTSTSDKVLLVGVAGVIDQLVLDGSVRKWAGVNAELIVYTTRGCTVRGDPTATIQVVSSDGRYHEKLFSVFSNGYSAVVSPDGNSMIFCCGAQVEHGGEVTETIGLFRIDFAHAMPEFSSIILLMLTAATIVAVVVISRSFMVALKYQE